MQLGLQLASLYTNCSSVQCIDTCTLEKIFVEKEIIKNIDELE